MPCLYVVFFFSSRRRHTRYWRDWSSDVCSSDLVQPIINEYWTKAQTPRHLIPGIAKLGIAGTPYSGYGCPGKSTLLDGMISMELSRGDPSISTFMGVHGGLAMGSIYLCGSEEQKERWLPAMARMELIGAFGLTEPDSGSDVARGLKTKARREGDTWVLDGQKKWIGNAGFADLVMIWAQDVETQRVLGFVVEKIGRAHVLNS